MPEPGVFLDSGLIILMVSNASLIIRDVVKYYAEKKRSSSDGSNGGNGKCPGRADMCIKHEADLAVTKREITEIRQCVGEVRDKIDLLYSYVIKK